MLTPVGYWYHLSMQTISGDSLKLLMFHLIQVSTTDSEVTQAASFAAEQLSSQSNSLLPFEVKEVLSARSKVAAGKVFELKLKLSQGDLPEQIVQASACQLK